MTKWRFALASVQFHVEIHRDLGEKELDDLMMSLSDFRLKEREEEPVSTNLDVMLGNLREDMDKQGVRTTQKGVCAACQKPIAGQVVTALGRTWHPEVRSDPVQIRLYYKYISIVRAFLRPSQVHSVRDAYLQSKNALVRGASGCH